MKKKIEYTANGKKKERTYNYIPIRYILALLLIFLEIAAVIAVMSLLTIYIPYFVIAVLLTQFAVAIAIINSDDNPDYKVPWLFFVLLIPIIGFMCYFMLYSRQLSKKQVKKLRALQSETTGKDDTAELSELKENSPLAYSQAAALGKLAATHVYRNTDIRYYPLGEDLFADLLTDLRGAQEFIFMEYFIIEDGLFWGSILEILKEKAALGMEVRVVYDDFGCMLTLPGNYYKELSKYGIKCVPFAKLKGQANNEFNNRSHRKITVIDGKIGYTGGINLADEYINHIVKHGHWKDVGIRLEGEAVGELTRTFLFDYELNAKDKAYDFKRYYRKIEANNAGWCVPFGDGPKPVFGRQVAKTAILNMLFQAERYVYITTPYLIIDNELVQALEDAAIRGVDVRIITPGIPDKKLIFMITRSYYPRLLEAGVKIYEYAPGFIHAKTYMADGKYAIVGTINLDYRSLVHHFENGVWMYAHKVIGDIEKDFSETLQKSILFKSAMLKDNALRRFVRAMIKVFTPLF